VAVESDKLKIKITKIKKFLKKLIMKKTIFNTLNQNIRKDLTNRIRKITKYLKLEIVKT
jgi:hypothetical protein